MITGGTPFIVAAFVFAYAVLFGYGLSLRARGRRQAGVAPATHAVKPNAEEAP